MISTKFFPTILIVLMTASAVVCGFDGDIRKVIYWISGAAITASVTY